MKAESKKLKGESCTGGRLRVAFQGRIILSAAFPFLLFAFTFLLSGHLTAQQTPQFSQYTFNGLTVNPAYAGYKEDWTARLSYRIQWAGLAGSPGTGTVSIDGLLNDRDKKMGVGLVAVTDRIGPQTLTSVYANYAYRLQLDEEDTRRLCFGAGLGVTQYSLNATLLQPTDLLDTALPAGDESGLLPDVRAGIYYSSSAAYLGLSGINLLSGKSFTSGNNLIQQVRHFYLVGGLLLPFSASVDLKPSLLVKEDFKGPTNLDISNYVAFQKVFWIGVSYRRSIKLWNKPNLQNDLVQQDAFAALTQLYWNNRFRLGYSYDFTTGKLAGYQTGTHEISLSISFLRKKERTRSPRFF